MNIYVGNLADDVSNEDLQELFEQYGKVESVNVLKDRYSGLPRGFGFVEMPSKNEAIEAINNLNKSELKGSNIIVNEARPKNNDRNNSGGHRRQGGGGGGRGGYGNKRRW